MVGTLQVKTTRSIGETKKNKMNTREKLDFIDEFLMRCEDWMHGQDGVDVTTCRIYLMEIQVELDN
jgi:hypothetical protein